MKCVVNDCAEPAVFEFGAHFSGKNEEGNVRGKICEPHKKMVFESRHASMIEIVSPHNVFDKGDGDEDPHRSILS